MFVNARAIIERETPTGIEIVVQTRNKPHERKATELPGGRVEEFESLVSALKREVQEETGLTLTHIEGVDTRVVDTQSKDIEVECLRPFAVYQTTSGPVDSMGVYFRCKAEGKLFDAGDDTEGVRWAPVHQVAEQMEQDAERFSWVDRAGLRFYLKRVEGEEG